MAFTADKVRQGVQQAAAGGYSVDNSLRFNDDDSAYLNWTPSSAGNRKTWTWSGWVKRGNLAASSSTNWFFGGGATNNTRIGFHQSAASKDDLLVLYFEGISGGDKTLYSSRLFRDSSAWYHIAVVVDTTQSTASDRVKLYINNELETLTGSYPATQNADTGINGTDSHGLGTDNSTGLNGYFDGYLAEVHFIDGQALDHTSFGETGDYGEWKPIEVTGMTYGTNGFYLDFGNKGTKHTITANGNVQHDTARSKIGSSSIEFDGASDYLSIPQNADWAFGDGDFTIEYWVNMWNTPSSTQYQHLGQESGADYWRINHNVSRIELQFEVGGSTQLNFSTSGSQITAANVWYHIALVKNGSTATCYLDGTSVGSSTWSGNMGEVAAPLLIGNYRNATEWMDGFMDEIRISNTARYTSSFTPSTTAFTDDSNTLLLIHSDTTNGSTTFTDDSGVVGGLGNDASSNTNNWTVNNLAATDQMLDSPTNNFACMNPLSDSSATLSQGNLQNQYGGGNYYCPATFQLPKTGKWYWEVHITALHSNGNCYGRLGITYEDSNSKTINDGYGYGVYNSGLHMLTSTGVYSTGLTDNVGDIIQFAVDMDNGKFYIGQDDTYYNTSSPYGDGNPSAGTNPSATGIDTTLDWRPDFNVGHDSSYGTKFHANFGQDSSFAGNKTAQGNQDSNSIGDFYYEPPTDFLALCTSNLPDPAVIPSEHFNTVLWTGNSSTNAITGVGFQPNLTWVKCRTDAYSHYLHDVLRTTTSFLYADQTSAENTGQTNTITSFDSDGFSLGSNAGWNASGQTYVSWNWKAGGADVLNENGTIDSQVSANADAGFSIVSWNGTGVDNSTIGHGLSKAPEMIITKKTNQSDSWNTFHKDLTSGNEIFLDLTSAQSNDSNNASWGDNHPASVGASTFAVGYAGDMNGSDVEMIAYCFHSVEGYSKVGSYTGNGSADGTFVYLGFRPSLILSKRSDSTGNWTIWDSERNGYNTSNETLHANDSTAEANETRIDLTSNGFKYLLTGGDYNASGGTYIYIAFAETPFKYTNAR